MGVLWRHGPLRAAEVLTVVNRSRERALAYTTVLNVLLNLEKKNLVDHTTEGRAFRFAPKLGEAALVEREARRRARQLLDLFGSYAVAAFLSEVRSYPALEAQLRDLLKKEDADGV